MSPLSQANIAVILSSVATTLLLLRNRQITLYQSLNFILSLSNYLRFRTMLFGITTYAVLLYTASAVDIPLGVSGVAGSVVLFNMYSIVILNDLSISSSASILSWLCFTILSVHGFYHNYLCLVFGLFCLWSNTTILFYIFLTVSSI